jgi:poly(hydroxyalkanoate) depolymerase family esterase
MSMALTGALAASTAGAQGYELFVPSTLDRARPAPLVVLLHGCTQDGADVARGARMNEIAERMGFLVLYPSQPASANPWRCWNWYEPAHQRRGAGEPARIEGMTRAVMRAHRVDPRRVHVAGISAGGAMAMVVAAAYPELYASAASLAGIAVGAAADQNEALQAMRAGTIDAARLEARLREALGGAPPAPLLLLHGATDTLVVAANATRAAAAWAAVAGARAEPAAALAAHAGGDARPAQRTRFVRPDGSVAVELVVIDGLGHAWPGGAPTGTFTEARGPSASALMAEFFARTPSREGTPR